MTSATLIRLNSSGWPIRVFLFCFASAFALVLMDVFFNYGGLIESASLRRIFNITREDGLATWFMVIQTFCAGMVLALIAVVHRSRGAGIGRVTGWGLLSVFFVYLSADDGAEIHERLGSTFKVAFREADSAPIAQIQGWYPSYDWQLVVLPFLTCAGVLMLLFLLREFRSRKPRLVLFGAPAVMALAIGLDFLEGLDAVHPLNLHTWLQESYNLRSYTVSHFSKALEEFLEMCSIALLLGLFLQHLLKEAGPALGLNMQRVDTVKLIGSN
jgi:hypothetical protein